MTDELQYYGDPSGESGFTVVARVYDSTGTQQGGDISCTEVGSLAIYIGDAPTLSAGSYGVRFFSSSTLLGQGELEWDGAKEVTGNPSSDEVETNLTYQESHRLIVSAVGGLLSGARTDTIRIRDTNNTKDRITASVDGDGNRTAITYDVS